MSEIITIISLGLISALVGFAFQRMLSVKDKMIFAWYWVLLSRLSKKNKLLFYIAKPLGLCIICNTTWIGFIVVYLFDCKLLAIVLTGLVGTGIVILIENLYHLLQRN